MSIRARLKILGMVATTVMAATAFTAQGASATTWTTAKPFINGQVEKLKPNLNLAAGTKLKGEVSGFEVELSATTLEAIEPPFSTVGAAYIAQHLEGGTERAVAFGRLRFTGVTVTKPKGCGPPEDKEITTAELKGTVTSGTPTYLNLETTSGTTLIATFKLTGTCAIAGTPIKVSTTNHECAQINDLGVMAVKDPFSTSPAILKACGGTVYVAGLPAELTFGGSIEVATGANWGVNTP